MVVSVGFSKFNLIWNRLYLEACKANDGTTVVDMMVVTLSDNADNAHKDNKRS